MSFKRDGDDEGLLKNLNHQRVRELLGSHIPEDEAKLLSNGRLACTICLYRPVFDTINMLAIHRKGRRHLHELSKFIKCKEEAVTKQFLWKSASSREFSVGEESSTRLTQPALLNSPMLGSRHVVAKQSALRHQRKPVLEIQPTLFTKTKESQISDQSQAKTASATIRQYLKSIARKSSLEKVVEKNRENYGVDLPKGNKSEVTSSSGNIAAGVKKLESDKLKKSSTPTNNESQDYEMKLRMSGWIKDLSGNWIKDPNAEFDSDEDEIPAPPT